MGKNGKITAVKVVLSFLLMDFGRVLIVIYYTR